MTSDVWIWKTRRCGLEYFSSTRVIRSYFNLLKNAASGKVLWTGMQQRITKRTTGNVLTFSDASISSTWRRPWSPSCAPPQTIAPHFTLSVCPAMVQPLPPPDRRLSNSMSSMFAEGSQSGYTANKGSKLPGRAEKSVLRCRTKNLHSAYQHRNLWPREDKDEGEQRHTFLSDLQKLMEGLHATTNDMWKPEELPSNSWTHHDCIFISITLHQRQSDHLSLSFRSCRAVTLLFEMSSRSKQELQETSADWDAQLDYRTAWIKTWTCKCLRLEDKDPVFISED